MEQGSSEGSPETIIHKNISFEDSQNDESVLSQSSNSRYVRSISNYNTKGLKAKKICLSWEDVNVYIPERKTTWLNNVLFKKSDNESSDVNTSPKQIIKNVSGIARPYQILAIMGSSGSGKTTLLNVLNFRNRGSLKVFGEIKMNGQLIETPESLSAVSGYVQQDDLFVGTLTVKEHLLFQAMLRMDSNTTKQERLERIEEVLVNLNLKKCENSMIGIPELGVKGISGGQRRRLSFASEVITNPSILFCDEPTSGLDSFMAISIIECMKCLAECGKTIICTIHQPSSELFEMFDKLCLITEGRLAFLVIPPMLEGFSNLKGINVLKAITQLIFIRKLSISPYDREKSLHTINVSIMLPLLILTPLYAKLNGLKICDAFQESATHKKLTDEINRLTIANSKNVICVSSEAEIYNKPIYKANMFTQIKWLYWRQIIASLRNPLDMRLLFIQTLIMALVFGSIYFRLELDQEGIQNITGALFIFLLNCSFGTLFAVINWLIQDVPKRNTAFSSGRIRTESIEFSLIISPRIYFPNYTLVSILFASIFYWMTNLNNDIGRFFICVGIIILAAQTTLAYGQFISSIVPLKAASTDLAGPVTVPFMIFSGYFLNNNTIPKYFLWIKYMSWFGYANEALVINQWSGVKNITCNREPSLCFLEGEEIIDYLNIDKDNFLYNIFMMVFLIVGWRCLSVLALIIKSYKR